MPITDHEASFRGRAFLWGGLVLGLLLVVALLTRGFGLLGGAQATRPGDGSDSPGWMIRKDGKIIVPDGSPLRARLGVMPATAVAVSPTLVLPAVVEADPARTVAVLTPLGGRLTKLEVGLGDRVKRGQILAVIDSPDLAQAYDDDQKAAVADALAAKNLERQVAQNTLGVASDRDLDQAKSDRAQAAAEYARTESRLKMLGTVPGRVTRLLSVTAPVDGSVISLSVATGAMINDPTMNLMTVADLGAVWVTAMVAEKDIASVSRNQEADISLLAYPDRPLHGKVSFVADVVEPDSRRTKIRIAVANTDYALKPNMYAKVTLSGTQRQAVLLPSSALLMNNDRTSVFVATAPWTFERRVVDPQLDEGAVVAIRSGVAAGEQVVVRGGILLND